MRLGVASASAVLFLGTSPTAFLAAAVFFVCLQRSFWVTRGALGTVAPAATGAVTGLLVTLPLALSLDSAGDASALLGTAFAIAVALPPVEHSLRSRIIRRPRVAFLGAAGSWNDLTEELARERNPRFEVVSLLDDRTGVDQGTEALHLRRPDIVVSDAGIGAPRPHPDAVCLDDFLDDVVARVPPQLITTDRFADPADVGRPPISALTKRAFDIAVATAGLAVTLPLWTALLLVSFGRRGGFFRQLRVGRGGKVYTMYKLRTMRPDAELPGQAVWAQAADTRATPVGRFLRETHLDELPQLWNVLRGEMSIVGPRPERPEFDVMLEHAIPHWTRRHAVKPGITGWAQVQLGYTGDRDGSERKLSYDLWYIRHCGPMLDLAICLQTIASLVPRRPAR